MNDDVKKLKVFVDAEGICVDEIIKVAMLENSEPEVTKLIDAFPEQWDDLKIAAFEALSKVWFEDEPS